MRFLAAASIAAVCMVLVLGAPNDAGERPKYRIADVMNRAMKNGLFDRVASGRATAQEKATLVDLFTSLHQSTPPKGALDDWKEKTQVLLDAAKRGDSRSLKAAANCMACHKAHKK